MQKPTITKLSDINISGLLDKCNENKIELINMREDFIFDLEEMVNILKRTQNQNDTVYIYNELRKINIRLEKLILMKFQAFKNKKNMEQY